MIITSVICIVLAVISGLIGLGIELFGKNEKLCHIFLYLMLVFLMAGLLCIFTSDTLRIISLQKRLGI